MTTADGERGGMTGEPDETAGSWAIPGDGSAVAPPGSASAVPGLDAGASGFFYAVDLSVADGGGSRGGSRGGDGGTTGNHPPAGGSEYADHYGGMPASEPPPSGFYDTTAAPGMGDGGYAGGIPAPEGMGPGGYPGGYAEETPPSGFFHAFVPAGEPQPGSPGFGADHAVPADGTSSWRPFVAGDAGDVPPDTGQAYPTPIPDPYATGPGAQPHAGYPAPGGFDPGALETTLILPQIGGDLPTPGASAELHPPSGYFHAVSIGDTDFGGLPSGTFGGADGFGSGAEFGSGAVVGEMPEVQSAPPSFADLEAGFGPDLAALPPDALAAVPPPADPLTDPIPAVEPLGTAPMVHVAPAAPADVPGMPGAFGVGAAALSPAEPVVSYTLNVNGALQYVADGWIGDSLLTVLRDRLGLSGAKDGCGQGVCGACTVLVDGAPAAACLVSAATLGMREVTTVEGLTGPGPAAIRQGLIEQGAVQCGYCIPGVVVSAHALLARIPRPDEATVRRALAGHPCRCVGPNRMVAGVCAAAAATPPDAGHEIPPDASAFAPAGAEDGR